MPKQLNQIIVEVVSDSTIALLKNLPYEIDDGFIINEEIVRIIINQKGIKNNVSWLAIQKAIKQVVETRQPVNNLIIAKATSFPAKIYQFNYEKYYPIDSLSKFKVIWQQFAKIMEGSYKNDRLLPVFFYLENEPIFELYYSKDIDVFGNEKINYNHNLLLACNDSIKVEEFHDKVIYRALSSGYLIVDENNFFCILNPLEINKNETELLLKYYPISGSLTSFNTFLNNTFEKFQIDQMPDVIGNKTPTLCKIILKNGREAIQGKNAEIIWIFKTDTLNKDSEAILESSDVTPYKKINSNTLIAIKIPCLKGQNGIDIYGKIIPSTLGSDLVIRHDSNIHSKEINGEVHYVSSVEGIFFKINNSISIESAFILKSDVDETTGDIIHDGAVVVIGNIKAGFKVSCKNKLYVKGSVENGCNIFCEGDISIAYGVVGEKTVVHSKGGCEIGFVIDAKIISTDKLLVFKYAQNASLFCQSLIEIKGLNINNNKSALIGGIANSLIKIVVHSVGSDQCPTKIILGRDLFIENKMNEMKIVLPSLSIKYAELNKKINLLISKDKVPLSATLSPEIKILVKNTLAEIKKVKDKESQIKALIANYEQMLNIDDLNKVRFEILNHVAPEVFITINNHKHIIKEEIFAKLSISLIDKNVRVVNIK